MIVKYARKKNPRLLQMPPKIDKVGTKCLATAPGQSYTVEVWEKDPGSLSTAASPQH